VKKRGGARECHH